jgi:hypothetical protein
MCKASKCPGTMSMEGQRLLQTGSECRRVQRLEPTGASVGLILKSARWTTLGHCLPFRNCWGEPAGN